MGTKVAKFGGSSLANSDQFRKAQQIVRADPDRRYIVPSAPGRRFADDQKITDLLYLCHASAAQKVSFDETFELIRQRYQDIATQLGLAIDLGPLLDTVRQDIRNGASADYAASRGEYLNAHLMAALLDYDFVDAAEIIHFNARGAFDADQTQAAVSQRLTQHERAVVPGFYGSLPDGSIKTFSRGGSDITGSIVARGVAADVYENWTDVSGMLMADPRIVESPKPIEVVTYQELRELAYMGATVLHDEAIFPVREAGIPVHIRNTNEPDAPGTRIVSKAPHDGRTTAITGIAGRKDFTVISLEKTLMNAEVGFGRRLLTVLEANDIQGKRI
jgi:aspartate kinase